MTRRDFINITNKFIDANPPLKYEAMELCAFALENVDEGEDAFHEYELLDSALKDLVKK